MQPNQQQSNDDVHLPEPVVHSGTLESLARAEIDIQIATAHHYPRSIAQFKRDALGMATLDEETAASCFYCVPRGGKQIEGPSVRLAEIVGSAWGNLRYGARIVSEDNHFVVAQGICHDLQKNNSTTIEVRRRITDSKGRRYSDDMIGTTCNAACAIALRNAIFKVVPFAYVKSIYDQVKLVAVGTAQTLVSRRTKALEYFAKMGVVEARLLNTLGKKSVEDIDLDDLTALTGLKTAIKDGDTTVDQAFPQAPATAPPPVGKMNLREERPEEPAAPQTPAAAPVPAETVSPSSPEPAAALLGQWAQSLAIQLDDNIDGTRNPKDLLKILADLDQHEEALGREYERLNRKAHTKLEDIERRANAQARRR